MLRTAGFALRGPLTADVQEDERHITAAHLGRWFSRAGERLRPSYADHLLAQLTTEELQRIERCFRRQLLDQAVLWRTSIVYVIASTTEDVLA
jgi:hypothetical protein